MFRYFAAIWNPDDQNEATRAASLTSRVRALYGETGVALRHDGLAVHWTDARTRATEAKLLEPDHGVILGKVFSQRRDSFDRYERASFDHRTTAEILGTRGKFLVERFWGRYVAIIRDGTKRTVWVIRDPIGALPCFVTSIAGVHVLFSSIDDCIALGLRFSIDWEFVSMHLACGENERLSGTGIVGVSPLLAGECVELNRDRTSRQFYWHPADIVDTAIVDDAREAVCELRRTVRGVVHAWSSCYDRILHRLSGGFDSSLIACCLSQAPTRPVVTCINHYSAGGESDERQYARAVAQHAGIELIERERTVPDLRRLAHLSRYPHARYVRYAVENGRVESSIAKQRGASAIFSGEWGDSLFYFPEDMHPAIDCAWVKGWSRSLLSVALDVARNEGLLVWSVLMSSSIERVLRRHKWSPNAHLLLQHRTLLSKDVLERARSHNPFAHPWGRFSSRVPIGKRRHIFQSLLTDLHPFYDPLGEDGDPDQVAPLNSQPLVELCLRIPTYVHSTGGWDRAIARRAFIDVMPRAVVVRRTKGDIEGYQRETFAQNITYIRDVLLCGRLVQRGLLDRTGIENVLSTDPTQLRTSYPELYWYVCMESWLATWESAGPVAMA
jgi:asparagine synthase (glutamine-hydrolysing)